MRNTFGGEDPLDAILSELKAAAPFKFLLPLNDTHLNGRLEALQLPPEAISHAQTLVVLPLVEGAKTQEVVERAVDELCVSGGVLRRSCASQPMLARKVPPQLLYLPYPKERR